MPAVPYSKGTTASKRVYVGLLFDEYSPAVESQVMRDCMVMQGIAGRDEEIVLITESDKLDKMLDSLGLRRIPTGKLAKMWILYRSQSDEWPAVPDWATTEVRRDLYVPKKNPNILRQVSEQESNGYYLPPQGRLSPDTLSLERPAPNGYVPLDTSIFFVWGP